MDELGEFEAFLNVPVRRVQRPLRDRLNPLTAYDEIDFFDRYRMDKSAFQELSTLIEPKLSVHSKNSNRPLYALQQLSLGLFWLADSGKQRSVGDCMKFHQSTVSKYLPIITDAIASLAPDIVRFPSQSTY